MGKYIILSLLFVVPSLCLAQSRVGYAFDADGNHVNIHFPVREFHFIWKIFCRNEIKMYLCDMLRKTAYNISLDLAAMD